VNGLTSSRRTWLRCLLHMREAPLYPAMLSFACVKCARNMRGKRDENLAALGDGMDKQTLGVAAACGLALLGYGWYQRNNGEYGGDDGFEPSSGSGRSSAEEYDSSSRDSAYRARKRSADSARHRAREAERAAAFGRYLADERDERRYSRDDRY